MITEMDAAALMAEANPVPDLDSYDVADPGIAAYLTTLEQRSSEVTQLDTKRKDQQEKKTIRPWLVAAAVVVIVAGVAVILINQSDEAPIADQSGEVTIENVTGVDTNVGSFTATGSMICEAGDVTTIAFDIGETLWWYEDVYRCADNSGSFTLRGELPLNDSNWLDDHPIADLEGTWTLTGYGGLEGGGTVVFDFEGTYLDWVESYVGELNEVDE